MTSSAGEDAERPHDLMQTRKVGSGWTATCRCGRVLQGFFEDQAIEDHTAHVASAVVSAAAKTVFSGRSTTDG